MELPTRNLAKASLGPKIDIDPVALENTLSQASGHGLTELMMEAEGWQQHVWTKFDLSAPMRALYVAEELGLLQRSSGDRARNIPVQDITNEINRILVSKGRKAISVNTVTSNLRHAAKWIHCALDLYLQPDPRMQTVRFVDDYEIADLCEKHIKKAEVQLRGYRNSLAHLEAQNRDTTEIRALMQEKSGLLIALPQSTSQPAVS